MPQLKFSALALCTNVIPYGTVNPSPDDSAASAFNSPVGTSKMPPTVSESANLRVQGLLFSLVKYSTSSTGGTALIEKTNAVEIGSNQNEKSLFVFLNREVKLIVSLPLAVL